MASLVATSGYFLPGGLVVHLSDIGPRRYDRGEEGRKGNGEMGECSKEKEKTDGGGERERETEKMRREEQEERQSRKEKKRGKGGGALYAFLSSRGFVCNNLCGKTA